MVEPQYYPIETLHAGRGYINPRNMTVLATILSLCRVKNYKMFTRTLGKISLIGSYKVWLARRSNEWAPGRLIRA